MQTRASEKIEAAVEVMGALAIGGLRELFVARDRRYVALNTTRLLA
jgi:hypothetical protein